MSSGGSNYSTGTTGNGPMTARIESPISKGPNAPQGGMSVPVDSFSSPAPGGKGGFPSAQSPYAQQQPQIYMPPQQPTMYQQAFPQQYSPYSYRNAYARPYSYSSPIQARPPIDEMNYAPGGLEQAPQQLMSDSWRRRPGLEYAGPTNEVGQFGGPGPTDPSKQMNYALGRFDSNAPKPMPESNGPILSYPGGSRNWNQQFEGRRSDYQISEIPYQGGPRLTPVAAAQGVRPEPNYSGGLGSLLSGTTRQNLNPNASSPGAQPVGGWVTTAGGGMLWNA